MTAYRDRMLAGDYRPKADTARTGYGTAHRKVRAAAAKKAAKGKRSGK